MRLKHVKGAEEAILQSEYILQEPQLSRGTFRSLIPQAGGRVCVEIGMGKGQFITTLALQHPENLYIGIEKFSSVLIRAVEKQQKLQLPNLLLMRIDAETICDIFAPGEIDIIYLNFSDPWPKDRHAKRRLSSPQFLERYGHVLSAGGRIEFKTDNRGLFDYSVASITESGWMIDALTYDLHADEVLSEGNIMTEYEEKFSSRGNPICKVIFRQ